MALIVAHLTPSKAFPNVLITIGAYSRCDQRLRKLPLVHPESRITSVPGVLARRQRCVHLAWARFLVVDTGYRPSVHSMLVLQLPTRVQRSSSPPIPYRHRISQPHHLSIFPCYMEPCPCLRCKFHFNHHSRNSSIHWLLGHRTSLISSQCSP